MKQDIVIHKNSPSLHLFSGVIAFFIYAVMLILLIGGFKFYKEQVRYGEIDSNISEIITDESIELSQIVEQNINQNIQQSQQEIIEEIQKPLIQQEITQKEMPKEIVKEKQQKPQESKKEKEVDLADVFSNVSSETYKDRKAREKEQEEQQKELKRKQLEEEQKARAEQLAQNAAAIKQSTQALQQATQNLQDNVKKALTTKISLERPKFVGNSEDKAKYDKWYAQIEQILMNEWKKSSNFYQATTSAKVRIKIDSGGKLTYLYMITQSPYAEYNGSVIIFLKKMETRLLPPPPADGVEIAVNLENTLKH